MENLLLPSKIEFLPGESAHAGSVVVTPCFHGYGTTLGNGLRRVLLSSLPGAAVEGFKIRGVQHEFGAVEGVKEDVVEIMLNLKQLAVKVHTDEPVVLNISKKGPGKVTAKDIARDANVDVINKDLVIATLTAAKTFEMELIVGRGRGFKPAEEKDRKNYDLGTIIIDSIYTPVKDVGYKVDYTRVGDITNFEKLTLNIETNGTLTPLDAIKQATQILMDHFTVIADGVQAQTEIFAAMPALAEAVTEESETEDAAAQEKEEKAKAKTAKKKTTAKKTAKKK